MKKAAIGMLVVLALTLGLASPGESIRERHYTGCLTQVSQVISSPDRIAVTVYVGNKKFSFRRDRIKMGVRAGFMNYKQMTRWEPVLAQLRAAGIAKVKVTIRYDTEVSDGRVSGIYVRFNQPC